MSPIAPLFRSLLPVWMAISAAFTVAASSAASNDKTFDAALIEYLEHASNVQPEQTVATQATTNTVKAIENVLSEESREAVRHRCLETLAIILQSHNADTALASRNTLLSRAEARENYAVQILARLDRDAQPLLKQVHKHGEIDFGKTYPSPGNFHLLRMLRIAPKKPSEIAPNRYFAPQIEMFMVHSAHFSDRDLWIVDRFNNICYMELSYSGVTGAAFRKGRWPHLEVLHLAGCPVTDNTVSLMKVPSLVVLDLLETQIGKAGLRQLNVNQGGIKELWVSSPHIKGRDLAVLQEYRNLQVVKVRAEIIDRAAIAALSECRQLEMICVTGHVQAELLASLKRSVGSKRIIVVGKESTDTWE